MSKAKKRKLELTSGWCVHHIHGCTGMRKKRIDKWKNSKLTETGFLPIYSKSEKKRVKSSWTH